MESSPVRVLVVANRTAATDSLLDAVRRRAAESPAQFSLLVPIAGGSLQRLLDPDDIPDTEAAAVLATALPLLSDAAGGPVDGIIGVPEPLAAIQDAVNLGHYDEIILSTLDHRLSRWLKLDLPSKVRGLGLPVTTVTAGERAPAHA
ncbi:hypothetical protein DSM112329_01639 [Paraconexibacter sp. AEG42_29]|uniref:Universal stress protein n=1 Tax=Paraconexibacter sp. AEG42_29 TaxID=2997339 RepID=A0AAU7ASY2_9ACTN